jgi:predicted small secreted protein
MKSPRQSLVIAALLLLASLLLAACVEPGPGAGQPTPTSAPPSESTATPAPPTPAATPTSDLPATVIALRELLARQLQLSGPEALEVVSWEEVEWPSACLGVEGEMDQVVCAQVVTPGYKVIFADGDRQYELHSNKDGSSVVVAAAPEVELGQEILDWRGVNAQGECVLVTIDAEGKVSWGLCRGARLGAAFAEQRHTAEWELLQDSFGVFIADGPDGSLKFNGRAQGPRELPVKSLIAFARQVWHEQQAGRGEPAWGQALRWTTDCDRLELFHSGIYYAQVCESAKPGIAPQLLTVEQFNEFYSWNERYAPFELAVAEASGGGTLAFSGTGAEAADATVQDVIAAWAVKLATP